MGVDIAFLENSIPFTGAKCFRLKHDFAVLSFLLPVEMLRRASWRGRGWDFRLDFWQWPSQDTLVRRGVQAGAPAV